jgi:hypothetical protein
VVVDVQEFFLCELDPSRRKSIEAGTEALSRLLGVLKAPLLFTLERPVPVKGALPTGLAKIAEEFSASVMEKDYFDLTKEGAISTHLRQVGKKQVILAGCETDVCILQSCLGLLDQGYEVFVVEDLLFSSTENVGSAIERMKTAGAIFVTFKTLFHELMQAVEGSPLRATLLPKELSAFEFD